MMCRDVKSEALAYVCHATGYQCDRLAVTVNLDLPAHTVEVYMPISHSQNDRGLNGAGGTHFYVDLTDPNAPTMLMWEPEFDPGWHGLAFAAFQCGTRTTAAEIAALQDLNKGSARKEHAA